MNRVRQALARNKPGVREIIAVTAIVLLALVLRTYNLGGLPAGFHGDEAVIGLEAQRILDDGYIGPYSPYAAGQPTGPIYLVALSVALFDNTVFAVRIVPALLGTLTVLALYVVIRRSFGIPAALIGASLLAVMNWHIYFARIGFPLEAWPLLAVLIAGALAEAVRSADWRWWALAGALTGSGIYVYNAHPLLAGVVGLFIAGYLVFNRGTLLKRDLMNAGGFGLAMVTVLIPMLRFATQPNTYYWDHFRRDRVTETPEWQELNGWTEQARFLAAGYKDIWSWLSRSPELDLVDGTGLTIIAPPSMLLLAAFGILLSLAFYRKPVVFFGLLVILIMPLSPVVSVGGEVRRTLVMTPFLAMFCALAVAGTIALAGREGRRLTYATALAGLAVVSVVGILNLNLYFGDFAEPDVQEEIFGKPLADASKYLDTLPDDYYVYFYSDIWSINYATRLFLAPDVRGVDRSHYFGEYSFDIEQEHGRPLFVFLGRYLNDVEAVRGLYPGREITPDVFAVHPTFRVYEPELP